MINIRTIQHYMYCPRRFGLLEIENVWAENVSVVLANIMHENVHSGNHQFKSKNKIVLSAVTLYNDELDLYGVADCVEFCKNKEGVLIDGLDGNFDIRIVEYKPKQPKDGSIRETDAIQVFAQKLCADYIWKCNSEGYIYYADTRKRVKMPFDEDYDKYRMLIDTLVSEMKNVLESGTIPKKIKSQKCNGCSIKDLCMPKIKKYSIKQIVEEGYV